jgi:hypothetical protein
MPQKTLSPGKERDGLAGDCADYGRTEADCPKKRKIKILIATPFLSLDGLSVLLQKPDVKRFPEVIKVKSTPVLC